MTTSSPIRLHWLDPRKPDQSFPDPAGALSEPNGLLAIGGDLSPQRLLNAYRAGIFPWFNPDEPILWWSPNPRCVLQPESLHLSHSLAKRMRQARYAVSFDRAFADTLRNCAAPRASSRTTWLSADMQQAYQALFRIGVAHSLEIWHEGQLAGGLYGVAIGRMFFGESMFSRMPDASKLAMAHLARQLADWGFPLIDCQVSSAHLLSLGATTMPREAFRRQIHAAQQQAGPARWQLSECHAGNPYHLPSGAP